MKFVIVLSKGDNATESIKREVFGQNNFADAAVEATKALMHSTAADNVTAYREYDNSTIAADHFFYAEKE
jgi:hypothetical protein